MYLKICMVNNIGQELYLNAHMGNNVLFLNAMFRLETILTLSSSLPATCLMQRPISNKLILFLP